MEIKKEKFKIGDIVKFDTSNYSRAYPQKRKHLKVCKLTKIYKTYSSESSTIGEAIWEDGTTGTVNLDYLSHTDETFTLRRKLEL